MPSRARVLLLALLVALAPLARACPGLSASGCSCTEERAKGSGSRRRVSCAGRDLIEPPGARALPDKTASL